MGFEQILVPILGGLAKGVGAGLEEKRKERSEAQARSQRALFDSVKNDWEAMKTPEMQRFLRGYLGKDYFPVFLAAKRAEIAAENRQKEDYFQGILYRQDQGQPTADMTGGPTNPTGYQAGGGTLLSSNQGDFGGGAPQGAGNPLRNLISQFTAQLGGAGIPAPVDTGPASGPQGVPPQRIAQQQQPSQFSLTPPTPGSNAATSQGAVDRGIDINRGVPASREGVSEPQIPPQAAATPQIATTQPTTPQEGAMAASAQPSVMVGKLPSGKPVVRQADGSFASHNLTVASDGKNFYVIPTIVGGKQLSDLEAVSVFQQSNGVDPDTGQTIAVYGSQDEAIKARDTQVAQEQQEIPGAVGHLRPAGVTAAQWQAGEKPLSATSKAFGGGKNQEGVVTVKDLPSGVNYNVKVGNARFSFTRPEAPKQEQAERLAAKDLGLPEDPQDRTAEQDRAVFVRSLNYLGEKTYRTAVMGARGKQDPQVLATNRIVAADAIFDRLKLERESEGSAQNIQTKRNLAQAGAEGTGAGQANVANQLIPTITRPDGTIVVVPQSGVTVTPEPAATTTPPVSTKKGVQPTYASPDAPVAEKGKFKGQQMKNRFPGMPEPAPYDATQTAPPGQGVPPTSAAQQVTPTQPQVTMRTREQIERENKATEARLLEREKPMTQEAARAVGGFQTQLGMAQNLSQTVNPAWLGVQANRTASTREKTARDSPGWEQLGLEGMSPEEGAFRTRHFTIGAELRKAITGLGGGEKEMENLDRLYPSLDVGSRELYQGQMESYLQYANSLVQHYVKNMVQGKGQVLEEVQRLGEQLKQGASQFAVAGWMFKNGKAPTAEQLQDGNYLRDQMTPEGKQALSEYRTRRGSGKIQLILPQ